MRKQKKKHNRIWTPIFKCYQKVRHIYGLPKPFALTVDDVFPWIGICLAEYEPKYEQSEMSKQSTSEG